jgi:L-tryptophan--pyruvate aminotransferase
LDEYFCVLMFFFCDSGDPTMFEAYWDAHEGNCVQLTFANERLSYFVKSKANNNGLWFVFEGLDDAIRDLHRLVGNAVVEDRHILVGTGSTQLFQAAAFALSKHQKIDASTAVVAEAPYYSVIRHMFLLLRCMHACFFVMIAVLGSCRSYGTTKCCKQAFTRSSLP